MTIPLLESISKISLQKENQLPFVLFAKPEETQVTALFQQNSDLHLSNAFDASGFVFAPFDTLNELPVWFYKQFCKTFKMDTSEFNFKKSKSVFRENELYTQLFHQKTVSKAVAEIKKGALYKVIISRKEVQQLDTLDFIQVFQNLCIEYPKAFRYCWYHPKVGMWMGASPETLIDVNQGNFETMALAGTQAFQGKTEVLWGEKEQQEQQIVVDAIVAALNSKNAVTNIEIKETKTHKAGSLLHLKTPISAQLKTENSLKSLIEVLHPTPAVCGLPYVLSKKFICNNEGYKRKYYTGFLGEINDAKNAQLFVNLRCMEVFDTQKKVAIYVGGGITAASHPEAEWHETVNKSKVMKHIL